MRGRTGTREGLAAAFVLALVSCTGERTGDHGTARLPPDLLDSVVTHANRGVALMDQYRPADAVEEFSEVVRLAPDWVTGRLNYGIALLNAQTDEGYAQAEVELKAVVRRDPDNPYAHYALGMLFNHLGRLQESRAEFQEVLRIDPDDADAHFQLGVLEIDDDPDAARSHLEATLARMPHHESAAYRLGTLLRRSGDAKGARTLLLRFQALKAARAGVASGMKYGEMGRYADIVRAFDTPRDADATALPNFSDVAAARGLGARGAGKAGWPGAKPEAGASSFGPGVGVADVDGSGALWIYLTASGADGAGVLYRPSPRGYVPVSGSGIDGQGAVGAFFGDYDGDGDADLYLTRAGANRLYRNEGGGRFTDVTASTHTAGGAVLSVGASWADADHDGDLDLFVADYARIDGAEATRRGAPDHLWRNNGDGTFTDVAPEAGIDGGDAATTGVLFFDADGDRDVDLYVIHDGSPNRVYLNDRVGAYTEATDRFALLADDGPGLGALLGDVDGNGLADVLLLRGARPARLILQAGRGDFVEDEAFGARARTLTGAVGGLLGDYDLDGDLDLALLGAGAGGGRGTWLLMNHGAGRFDEPASLDRGGDAPAARGAVTADLDGDGGLEILVARAGAPPRMWTAPPPAGRHWLQVRPVDDASGDRPRVAADADGLQVEVKAGLGLQVATLTPSSGFLGSAPRLLHFGLGHHAKADYVRLAWPDAVIQSELEVAGDQLWSVQKIVRKPSSCPILFVWDGERFRFVTDFLGVGGMGFFITPGVYAPPDPTEDVRIPPDLVAPRDGKYLLRVAEPLEEVTYLDETHLVVYDHPADWEVYPDERFAGSPPFPTGKPFAVARKVFPRAARDDRGRNVLDRLRAADRRYVEPPKDPRFVGYAEDHWMELDFGDRLRDLDPDAPLVLFLHGWVEYTYSHVNYAAYQAGVAMRAPSIEIPDGHGGWKVAVADAGFPAGLPRMMTLDISSLPIRDDGRLRIRSNMEIFWDQAFVGVDVSRRSGSGAVLRRHVLEPTRAELRPLGYPREYSPDGADPTLYDYQRIDVGVPFKNLTGDFTRFGDVRELLAEVDDRFVIMARGEEIALEFDAEELPELPAGWSRTVVLHADGFCKDMDLYTAFPQTVEPLPYHGMDTYPPLEPAPDSHRLREYRRTWNTRHVHGG